MNPFNEGQQDAINTRNASILVSAPAGSGKTKILVSRIVALLLEGYTIDSFLVLTFTEAAGNEMKQRLNEELNLLISNNTYPNQTSHLQKQLLLLPNAYITNFHGFCSQLLKKYGYLVDVMPGFSINSNPKMIKEAVLDDCIVSWLQDDTFKVFLSTYFPDYNFHAFKEMIMKVQSVSHSYPDFHDYLKQSHKKFYEFTDYNDWVLLDVIKAFIQDELSIALSQLEITAQYAHNNSLVSFYELSEEAKESAQTPYEQLYDYIDERVEALKHQQTFDTLYSLLSAPAPKLARMSWKDVDDDIKKQFNKLKDSIIKPYLKFVSEIIEPNVDVMHQIMDTSYEAIDWIVRLVDSFENAYAKEKISLNQLDFNDLESYATKLLGKDYPVCEKLYKSLKEIMIDEYQDTNQIQETLIQCISTYNNPIIPLFMVGDMKQSIYRFRQGDPEIFYQKYIDFMNDDPLTKRIDLVYNYRSNKIVLDSINYIFNSIMDEHIGGLPYYYDPAARLNYDFDRKEKNKEEAIARLQQNRKLETEVLINQYVPSSLYTKAEYEAHMVAQRIVKLMEEHPLKQATKYSDIAILMAATGNFLTFKKVFDQYHIPSHITLSQGLFDSNEVISLIQLLKILVNPYDDIAMVSVLRNHFSFSSFNEEEIISLRDTSNSLYQNLLSSEDSHVTSFRETYDVLKTYAYTHSPYETLLECLRISEFQAFVSSLINGEQRSANIDLLVEIFRQNNDYDYLIDYLDYLETGIDSAPGILSQENNDAVEFMSIHKSKGLQFPIVFVCQLERQFIKEDSIDRLLIDKNYGVALKPRVYKDIDHYHHILCEYENKYRKVVGKLTQNESVNEQMRLLYVALTRAAEKLILTGSLKSLDNIVLQAQKILGFYQEGDEDVVYNLSLRRTNNFLDWITQSLLQHPDILKDYERHEILGPYLRALKPSNNLLNEATYLSQFKLVLTDDETIEKDMPIVQFKEKVNHYDIVKDYYEYQYPYQDKERSIAVTTLQKIADDHFDFSHLENETSNYKATDKGTLIHNVLSYLSFNNDSSNDLIERLYHFEMFNKEEYDILLDYKEHLDQFISSNLYQMISESSSIYKEKSFRYKDQKLNQVVNGIFDLVFIKDDIVYVLDYKTDRMKKDTEEDVLRETHRIQLEYYKKVLKAIFHKETKAFVYYLHIDQYVEI